MKKKSNLTLFMKQLIRSLKEEERFSTAHIYQSTLNAFMLFCKTDAIRFNQMERSRLKQFENHLRNKGCTWNTVSTYMRTLRSIYNKAVDDGLAEEKPRLFRHVYTGVKANTKRALDAKDMSKLLSASLPRPLPQSMKEISLSYDFPQSVTSKLRMSGLSLKFQATNPFLIYSDKKLQGQDPEFFNTGGVAVPMPKQFTLTLRVSF